MVPLPRRRPASTGSPRGKLSRTEGAPVLLGWRTHRTGRRGSVAPRAVRHAARTRTPLRCNRARVLDAHRPGRDNGVVVAPGRTVAPLLQRIAAEQLVLVTNGASDWLDSSGA